jgi:outer membrane protein assembly factor BamB
LKEEFHHGGHGVARSFVFSYFVKLRVTSWFFILLLFCSMPVFAQSGPSADTANTAVNTTYLWRQAVGGAVIGRPTVQAQSVVMVLDGGNIKAYSSSGRPLWNFSAKGRLSPYVTRSREGTSYICRTNGIFIAVNRVGRELWRVNIGQALTGPVVLGWDGRVFIPAAQKIFCYTASGNLLWVRELASAISAGPWLDQAGGILLALETGDAVRFDPYGAALVRRLPSVPRILLSVSPGPVILVLYHDGGLQLINPALPDAPPLDLPRLPSPPLAAASRGSNAAAALTNGQIVLLSGIQGTILWTADTHVRMGNDTAVIYDERGIYVLSANGAAGFTVGGERLWFATLKNASGIPAFDDEGILYSGGTDWILYAWKLEDRALNRKRDMYGPAPEGSYGLSPSLFRVSSGFTDDAQMKSTLETIRRESMAGRVGENEREWLACLMEIAGGGLRQVAFSYNRPRALISSRILALQLLSRIGSRETIPWLARFFRNEEESLVKAAAARAIGDIGVDPTGAALQEFLAAIIPENPFFDEQVLIAVAAATGALCRFSGPPLFNTGARILVLLSGISQPSSVQRQARHELDTLAQE